LGDVLKQGLSLTAVGLAAGLAGAFAVSRLMSALLFGVEPSDPATLAAVAATIAGVALSACIIPAWRASRVDPIVVLRDE
jgi:ABC-type antimicrobial peptide transport system permease subunit